MPYNINKQFAKNRNKTTSMTVKVKWFIINNFGGKGLKMIYDKIFHIYLHISSVLCFVAIIGLYLCVQLHLFIQLADGMQQETHLIIPNGWEEN